MILDADWVSFTAQSTVSQSYPDVESPSDKSISPQSITLVGNKPKRPQATQNWMLPLPKTQRYAFRMIWARELFGILLIE